MNHTAGSPEVLPLSYQAGGIPFQEWLAQLTLCLAPFAAHLLAGVPAPASLETSDSKESGPPMWRYIPLFNPVTIMWRYMAIADRRIRAISWDPDDLATVNPAFWIDGEWTGSETIAITARSYITRRPTMSRVSLLSISFIGTIIILVQGIQAVYQVCLIFIVKISTLQGISAIFIPLAIGSLFRLPPALWLTDDFGFERKDTPVEIALSPSTASLVRDPKALEDIELLRPSYTQTLSLRQEPRLRFRPQSYWPSVVFKSFYLLLIAGLTFGLGIGHIAAKSEAVQIPMIFSDLSIHSIYLVFLVLLLATSAWYICTRQANTTMIPCINSAWYIIATIIWYCLVVASFIFNVLEMRRAYCGVYTTYPASVDMDKKVCALVDA